MLRTTAIAKELAVIERKLQETTNKTLKDALKKKQTRLKDELNDFKKSTPALAKQLLAQRTQIKQLSKMDFNDLVRRLSKKPEYSFLRTMSKSTIKTDIERPAKPVGWRFKGRGNYDKPTLAEIKKGKRNDTVYREVRPLRSDVSQPLRLQTGGMIEIGDKVKASKEYGSKSGTVIDKRGSFVVVEYSNGESDSYHESDLVKKMQNGGNMKNAHMMQDGGVIGQEIVFDDNGEENKGVIKDIHEITGNYIVATDDGRTVLADKERDVISLGAIRKTSEAKKRFSFFEQGGNLDSMSLNQLLDKVPVFERMHIDGYSNYARSKEAFDDLVKEFGNKRYSEEESRQYDNFKKRKVMYENSYKQNVIKYLQSGKMSDGGNIAKENNEMLHSQAKEAKHHIEELHNVLTTKTKVEPWVVAKMTRAKTDLSDITHYLDSNTSKMQNGGKLTDAQQNKFDKVMREWKDGKLHSGSANGPIVKDQDQAIAIAYAEAYGTQKMAFGGMIDEDNVSTGAILRMEELSPTETLEEFIANSQYITTSLIEEGFEKDEVLTFLAHMMVNNIKGSQTAQSTSKVQQWTIEDENALDGWIMDIQDGFGWITPGYVESSWTSRPGSGTKEWNGDIQERVYQRLIDENMLFAENPNDYEKKGKKIKDVTTAIWTAAEENGYEHGGKMQTGGGVDTIHIGTKIKSSSQTYVVTKKSTFGFVMEAKNGDKMIKDEYEIKQLIERGQLKIVNEEYTQGGGVDNWVYWKIEKKVNGDDIVMYERTHASSPIIPNATEISKREYDENKYANGGGVDDCTASYEMFVEFVESSNDEYVQDANIVPYLEMNGVVVSYKQGSKKVAVIVYNPRKEKLSRASVISSVMTMFPKEVQANIGNFSSKYSLKNKNLCSATLIKIVNHNGELIEEFEEFMNGGKMQTGGGVGKNLLSKIKIGNIIPTSNGNFEIISFEEDTMQLDNYDGGFSYFKVKDEDGKIRYIKISRDRNPKMFLNDYSLMSGSWSNAKQIFEKGGKATGWKHKMNC